jgi:NhaP-type Na+/H+ or K+/H+ antiporter
VELLLAFAVLLPAGVLVAGVARRTILWTAVLVLLAGFVLGDGVAGVLDLVPGDPIVVGLAEPALFSLLYIESSRIGLADLRSAWRLPGRGLVPGMPPTLAITALLTGAAPPARRSG